MMSILLPSANEVEAMNTAEECSKLFPDAQTIVCNDRYRKGKGWAIREALKEAKGDIIVFLDSDGDIKPKMIKRLLPYLEDYDIVCGVKPISGLWSRRILTFLSRYYIAVLFNFKCDSQTGIKLFKRHTIPEFYNNGFLFDLEILCLAKKNNFRIIEVPVDANVRKKMKMQSIWNTFKESLTLWLELKDDDK